MSHGWNLLLHVVVDPDDRGGHAVGERDLEHRSRLVSEVDLFDFGADGRVRDPFSLLRRLGRSAAPTLRPARWAEGAVGPSLAGPRRAISAAAAAASPAAPAPSHSRRGCCSRRSCTDTETRSRKAGCGRSRTPRSMRAKAASKSTPRLSSAALATIMLAQPRERALARAAAVALREVPVDLSALLRRELAIEVVVQQLFFDVLAFHDYSVSSRSPSR